MKSIAYLLLAIIVLGSLTTCNHPGLSSSESTAISSGKESAPISLDIEADIHLQINEILNAVKDLAPTAGIGEFDWDEALAEKAQTAIASLGYPVEIRQKDMPNYERVTDFFDMVKAGENAFVAVYSVRAYGSTLIVDGYVFEKDGNGFSKRYITVDGKERSLSERYPLKDIVLTENGNLIAYEADGGGDPARGFRVLPLPSEYREAYDKYVRLVDVQSDGVINQAWSKDYGFQNLSWEFVFEEIWERENGRPLIGKGSPYYQENADEHESVDEAIVPADVVEGTLQKYFNVPAETLRKMTAPRRDSDEVLYNPEDNTYRIWGFRGGGYKPTIEVWGITNNADGSVSLKLAWVSLDFGNDGTVYSVLTVMPEQGGGYKYISNIYSEDTVKEKVEYALTLAKSAEIIHQGGLAVTGDSIEKHGYHFAAVDIDKLHQSGMKLGGMSSTDNIKMWFNVIFEKDTAEKYIRQIFDVPLYIDEIKDGEQVLFVNQDVNGFPIAQGEWVMEDFAVLENIPDRITVQMKFDTADGKKTRALTLIPNERRSWVLTDSFDQEKSTAGEDAITSDTSFPHVIDAIYFENEKGARLYLGQSVEDCEAILGIADSSSERDKVSVTVSESSIEKASICIYKDSVVVYANGQAIAILMETKNLDSTNSWCLIGHPFNPVLNESASVIPEEYHRTSYVPVDGSLKPIGEDTVMKNISIYGPDNLVSCYLDYEDDRITNIRIGTHTGLVVMM